MSGKSYFFSDIHLGLPDAERSRVREIRLVKLLDEIRQDAENLFFVGDIFDFWWEYKHVVPRGYVRFLGKIAELADTGVNVYFFTGNHDIWLKNYLTDELGIKLFFEAQTFEIQSKKLFIAHGDGLGPGDKTYKILKKIFTNRSLQWLFSRLHPNFAFELALLWSHTRRKKEKYIKFAGADKEFLFLYANEILKSEHFDYFVFGHRHIPLIQKLTNESTIANIGEWLHNFTFLELSEGQFSLKTYKHERIEPFEQNLDEFQNISIF